MIELKNLAKSFNGKILYKDSSLQIENFNTIVTLWGPSGSGKTTLLNMIMGYEKLDSGNIYINNEKINKYITQKDISLIKQDLSLFQNVSVIENLKIVEQDFKIITDYLSLFDINELANKKVKTLSGGEKQRVEIIRALLKKPKILICDEPSNGLDEVNFSQLIKLLSDVTKMGTLVIIATHDRRFEEFSNVQVIIENFDLNIYINETAVKNIQNDVTTPLKISNTIFFSTFKTILKNQKNHYTNKLFLSSIVTFVFFMLATLMFSKYESYAYDFFNGMTDQIAVMSITDVREDYKTTEDGQHIKTTPDKLYWNQEDIQKIEHIKGVQSVYVGEDNVISTTDKNGMKFHEIFNFEDYKYLFNESLGISSAPENIVLDLNGVSVNSDIYKYYQGGNTIGLDIVLGSYPEDDTNQILIPDFLAKYLMQKRRLNDLSSIVGSTIQLNTIELLTNDESKSTYKISGIYDSNSNESIQNSYILYYSYQNIDPEIRLNSFDEDFYNVSKDTHSRSFDANKEASDYYSETYSSYENWKKAMGYGYSNIYIIFEDNVSSETIIPEIQNLYPNNYIKSQYTYSNDESLYASTFGEIRRVKSTFTLISIILIGSILYLIQKGYYLIKKKDYAMLYSQGYSKHKIIYLMCFEYMLDIVLIIISLILFIWVLHFSPISIFTNMYIYILSINTLLYIVSFLLGINLIQMCINIYTLKYDKLNKMI